MRPWLVTTLLAASALIGCPLPVEPPRTCDDIVAEFEAERAEVQQCATDDECGQILAGTSCGCTRDLVARLDADTTAFYALVDEGAAQECELGLTSVCDCPATVGFRCDAGTCAFNSVADWPYLPKCEAASGDPLAIGAAAIAGDDLVATVSYGGGCEAHDITLCWPDQAFLESYPVQVSLELFHDGHDDPCDAYLTEDRVLSLVPLRDAWHDSYGAGAGTIELHLDGFDLPYLFE